MTNMTFVPCSWNDATHYFLAREDSVLPKHTYDVGGSSDCVLPLRLVERGSK